MSSRRLATDLPVRLLGWRYLAVNSDPFVTDRALFVGKWLIAPRPDVRTLDAGCGNGAFSLQAHAYSGGAVLGLSDDREAIEKAQARAALLRVSGVTFR